jgi:two-component system, OmpR family, response regulator
MKNRDIVRDIVERRGAAPAVTTLRQANTYAPETRIDRRRSRGAVRTSLRSADLTELKLRVDGFSVVVRILPDGVSTKRGCGPVAAETRSLLLSTLETVIRSSHRSTAHLSSGPAPAAAAAGPDEEVATVQGTPAPTMLHVGPLGLDLLERTAKRGDRLIALRPREFSLLRYMMERSDRLLTRAKLLQEVWNYKFVPQTNLVDVHMGRLRRKVDGVNEPAMIRSLRGAGFVLDSDPIS